MLSGTAPVLGIVELPFGVALVLGTELLEFELGPLLLEGLLLPEAEDPPLAEVPPLFDVPFELLLLLPLPGEPFADVLPLSLELFVSVIAVGVVFLDEFMRLYNHFPPI